MKRARLRSLSSNLLAFALLLPGTLVLAATLSACEGGGGADEAVEEVRDEIEDAGDELEDEVDDLG